MDTAAAQTADAEKPRLIATFLRLAILFLLSIPAAALTVWDEILLAGPIVFLTEVLGFAPGLLVFIVIWAALGIAAMLAIDYVWPLVSRLLEPVMERFIGASSSGQSDRGWGWLMPLGVAAVAAGLTALVLAALLVGGEIKQWAADHQGDFAMFLAAAVVIFLILVVVDRLSRGLENWVRGIADTARPALRRLAALVAMVVLGPVLGWPVFRLLRYSRRSTYALTLLAAPVFGGMWVPFYSLGVWGLIEAWL